VSVTTLLIAVIGILVVVDAALGLAILAVNRRHDETIVHLQETQEYAVQLRAEVAHLAQRRRV